MTLTVGYLHVGAVDHGIRRYSQYLAQEAARTPTVRVREHCHVFASGQTLQPDEAKDIAKAFGDCHLAHVHYNKTIWGGRAAVHNVERFVEHLACPLVVTIHDIYVPPRMAHLRQIVKPWLRQTMRIATLDTRQRSVVLARGDEYRHLSKIAAMLVVCSREEQRRLVSVVPESKVHVVPHFVESMPLLPDPAAAKRELGLVNKKVVTLLGFIHQRKGHALVVEALKLLPEEYVAVFLGAPGAGPGCDEFVADLRDRATTLGVEGRLRITGYVDESDLATYLAATDLALCPFSRMSASSSLSTWIACRKPILGSNIPQIVDYNEMAPGAIHLFWQFTPRGLAQRIEQITTAAIDSSRDALDSLAERLAITAVYRQHVELYERIARARHASAG
ncbi:MAG: glycosyltransferase [Luteitalea sp.]|nr:glycosyltransferase [Luteitalea sp.]